MANQIRITPDQMRERANQYRAEADTVNGVIIRHTKNSQRRKHGCAIFFVGSRAEKA